MCAWLFLGFYGIAGVLTACRCVDWREKTWSFRWLPPGTPDRPNLNTRLATATLFVLAVLFWPAFLTLWFETRES